MKKRVFIDRGHLGSELGAVYAGVVEDKLNNTVGLRLIKFLQEDGRFEVGFTPDSTGKISLSTRGRLANEFKAEIFISVHHNAGSKGRAEGFDIYHSVRKDGSLKLARAVANEFKKTQVEHGVYSRESEVNPGKDYYGVLRSANMPAIITEYCFIDNLKDAAKVDTEEELFQEAEHIYNGILAYFGMSKKVIWGDVLKNGYVTKDHEADELVTFSLFGAMFRYFFNTNEINFIATQNANWKVAAVDFLRQNGFITMEHEPDKKVTVALMGAMFKNYMNHVGLAFIVNEDKDWKQSALKFLKDNGFGEFVNADREITFEDFGNAVANKKFR